MPRQEEEEVGGGCVIPGSLWGCEVQSRGRDSRGQWVAVLKEGLVRGPGEAALRGVGGAAVRAPGGQDDTGVPTCGSA